MKMMEIEYRKTPQGLQMREVGGKWKAVVYTDDYENLERYFQGVIAGLHSVGIMVDGISEVEF